MIAKIVPVILTINGTLQVLLSEQGIRETIVEDSIKPSALIFKALRESIEFSDLYLEQVYAFIETDCVYISYIAVIRNTDIDRLKEGSHWHDLSELDRNSLPNIQAKILNESLNKLIGEINSKPFIYYLMPELFTAKDMKEVYELIKNEKVEEGETAFHNRITRNKDIVKVKGKFSESSRKPAQLYKYIGD